MMIGSLTVQDSPKSNMETKKRSLNSGPDAVKTMKGKDIVSPPTKRMKQARLPFKPVSASPNQLPLSSPSPQLTKKRKLSDVTSPSPVGNAKPKQVDKKTTPHKKGDTPQPKKQSFMKGKKIGFGIESGMKSPSTMHFDAEVSSSSEDVKGMANGCDSTIPPEKGCDSTIAAKKIVKAASLDGFVQTTQQPQVSTTDIIDLTSDDDDDEVDENQKDVQSCKASIDDDTPAKDAETSSTQDSKCGNDSDDQEGNNEGDTSMISASSMSSQGQASSLGDDDSSEDEEDDGDDGDDGKDNATANNIDDDKEDKTSTQDQPQDCILDRISSVPVIPSNLPKPLKKTHKSTKALLKEAELQRKREEKQKLREEKKRKLEEEKEAKKRFKEQNRSLKEQEKEAQLKQKAEEKKKRQMEKLQKKEQAEQERMEKMKAKEEERKKKMEMLDSKQEERRKKQEEKQRQEEEKKKEEAMILQKKEKQSQLFKSFFKVQAPAPVKKPEVQGHFAPFQVMEDMVLAPCVRVNKENLNFDELEEAFQSQASSTLYLDQLKSGKLKLGKAVRTPGPTRPVRESSVECTETKTNRKGKKLMKTPDGVKAKLLQFHENYRPAYYGTWLKKSSIVSPRNPLKKDEDILDYDFDSDEEWEEPGESLSHSEGEDEDNDSDGDNEQSDDGFFVPHGYLSAGEGGDDEEDPDNVKVRRAAKARAWDNELKRRCEALKPIIITCMWVSAANKNLEAQRKKLAAYEAVTLTSVPIATNHSIKRDRTANDENQAGSVGGSEHASHMLQERTVASSGNKLKPVPGEAMPDLLRLVHGNTAGIKALIREFREYWRQKHHGDTGRAPVKGSDKTAGTPSDVKTSPSLNVCEQGASITSPSGSAANASPITESPGSVGSTTPVQSQLARSCPSPGQSTSITPSPQNLDHLEHLISKRQLDLKINAIATREKRPEYKRICWYVHQHVLEKYKLADLPVPTQWVSRTVTRKPSPLPPANITATPASTVNVPTATKVPIASPMTSGTPSMAPQVAQRVPAAVGQPQVVLPSSMMQSAFSNVGTLSGSPSALRVPPTMVPGTNTTIRNTALMQPISYISPDGTLLQHGLNPIQVLPLQMSPNINQGGLSVSSLLQQAAANSVLAGMKMPVTGHLIPTAVSSAAHSSRLQQQVPQKLSTPVTAPSTTRAPELPSVQKPSKPLDAAIAKLYSSISCAPGKPVTSPPEKKSAPVKKTAPLTNFFNVAVKPVSKAQTTQDKAQDKSSTSSENAKE